MWLISDRSHGNKAEQRRKTIIVCCWARRRFVGGQCDGRFSGGPESGRAGVGKGGVDIAVVGGSGICGAAVGGADNGEGGIGTYAGAGLNNLVAGVGVTRTFRQRLTHASGLAILYATAPCERITQVSTLLATHAMRYRRRMCLAGVGIAACEIAWK